MQKGKPPYYNSYVNRDNNAMCFYIFNIQDWAYFQCWGDLSAIHPEELKIHRNSSTQCCVIKQGCDFI